MRSGAELTPELAAFVRGFAGGAAAAEVSTLAVEASTRRYHRVRTGGSPASVVVMELGPAAAASPTPLRQPTRTDDRVDMGPGPSFLSVHRYLEPAGFPVPAIFAVDLEAGLIALEDLGDITFERAVAGRTPAERRAFYARALGLIADLQRIAEGSPDPGCVAFGRGFDQGFLRWELEHFQKWLLEEGRGVRLGEGEAADLAAGFDWLAATLAAAPRTLCHRDFQSRNLMVLGRPDVREEITLKVIDFQDALLGPQPYDVVALLRDSYVELEAGEMAELLDLFAQSLPPQERLNFSNLFHLQTVQRKLKDAGRFVFLDRVRGNPGFLASIPLSLRYVRDALRRVPELDRARVVLERHLPELRG